MRYAEIIVDLSAEALDRRFTYSVPETMDVECGDCVLVPFGPRRLEGFVVALTDTCDPSLKIVKPVLRRVYDYPVILPELMALAQWMHGYYLCNFVDALRLMLPVGMRGERIHIRKRRMVRCLLPEQGVERFVEENRRAKAQCEILRSLSAGELEASTLSPSALKGLVERGAVEIVDEEVRRKPRILDGDRLAPDPELMPAQKAVIDEINRALESGGGRYLLHGVTGSGKTEVYIRVVRRVLELGRTAIVLVPEIALTPQMVTWFHMRFGADAAVLHSRLSAGERYDEWRRIRSGEARVVIGARSAVFAPMESPALIVIDEEHEGAYLSDRRPRYDAREVAARRMLHSGGVLLLGSATPSVSTYMRAMPGVRPENRTTLLELRRRVMNRPLPTVEIVDMRREFEKGNRSIFSAKLSAALETCINDGKQAVLFLNRRGHSSSINCRACGFVVKCDSCDVSMTYHRTSNTLRCHYCGAQKTPPEKCPSCGSIYIKYFGIGTQRVEEEVQRLFPQARTLRVDVDTTGEKDAHEKLLGRFARGEANVMIGTQMIAKGLDFPNVTLVGAVSADMTLNLPDYRSPERTFQLLTQVAGRAGRAEDPGRVIIQTYEPEHYAIQLAAKQDYRAFYLQESAYRRKALYPPFTTIMRILYSGREQKDVEKSAKQGEAALREYLERTHAARDTVQMRAMEAPINRLREEWRWQVFIKMYFKGNVQGVIEAMQHIAEQASDGVRAETEVNPSNMI